MKKLKTIFLTLLLLAPVLTQAQESDSILLRPVLSAYTVQAGSSHLADTYLSPLKFNGWHTGIGYERMQAMKFNPARWVMQMKFNLNIDNASATYSSSNLWYAGIDFSWAMMHRWKLPYNITVAAGGAAALDLGCVYNSRNGNNPASAKAALTVDVTGFAAWNHKLGRLPFTLRYQPAIPITGAFFAPDYGELYYEIYLGNHKNLAHCAWWGNYFRMTNLLTLDLHFGTTALRLGYSGNILSTKINHTITNKFTHSFLLGIAGEWISLNPSKGISKNARIISALY